MHACTAEFVHALVPAAGRLVLLLGGRPLRALGKHALRTCVYMKGTCVGLGGCIALWMVSCAHMSALTAVER